MTDAAAIAAKLTKAQRDGLLRGRFHEAPAFLSDRCGYPHGDRKYSCGIRVPNETGLAVRAFLQEQQQ